MQEEALLDCVFSTFVSRRADFELKALLRCGWSKPGKGAPLNIILGYKTVVRIAPVKSRPLQECIGSTLRNPFAIVQNDSSVCFGAMFLKELRTSSEVLVFPKQIMEQGLLLQRFQQVEVMAGFLAA